MGPKHVLIINARNLDEHGIHPQPDALGDLVPVQVLDMVVYDQQGSGLVDAIVSILLLSVSFAQTSSR